MDKKFLYVLTTLVMFLSLAKPYAVIGQKKECYNFKLAIDNDTVYANNVTFCHFQLKCCRWLPKQIIINRIAYPNQRALNNHAVFLLVSHNERVYEDPLPTMWRFQDGKRWVARWKSIRFESELELGKVFCEDLSELKERSGFPCLRNTDYGEYFIRAIFVTEDNDTIYSNTKTIHYLER